jgi:tetratricopeptide (TPR) repeat protein
MDDLFEVSSFDLRACLQGTGKLVLLAGAGISMDPPSSLPSARQMMGAILDVSVPPKVKDPILGISMLRYEFLIECFHNAFDPDFKIMDYFQLAKQPNTIHAYLADAGRKGNWLLTTNFDSLIERAFPCSEPGFDVVLTPKDFETHADPAAWFKKGTCLLYKLHGSTCNIKTGEATKGTLVTTLSSLGKSKEGDVFSVESWKRPLFDCIGQDRTLVVMGYSGGDDFDIVPMLGRIPGLQRLIWISHDPGAGATPTVLAVKPAQEFAQTNPRAALFTSRADEVVYTLRMQTRVPEIFKVVVDTSKLIASLVRARESKQDCVSSVVPPPTIWLKQQFPPAPLESREVFAAAIFQNYCMWDEALSHYVKAHLLYRERKDERNVACTMSQMGHIYRSLKQLDKAVESYDNALRVLQKLGAYDDIAWVLANIGLVYRERGHLEKALEYNERSLDSFRKARNQLGIANTALTVGFIMRDLGKLDEALARMREALPIYESLGDLTNLAWCHANMGVVLRTKGNVKQSVDSYMKALDIFKKLGYVEGMASTAIAAGNLFKELGQEDNAIHFLTDAASSYGRLNDSTNLAWALANLGVIFRSKGDIRTAIDYYEKARALFKSLGHAQGITTVENELRLLKGKGSSHAR